MQLANRGKITGQGSYGNLSSVCRGATKLLAASWTQLAAHFLADSLHTAALTENVCETFFSLVTLSLGGGTMVSATQLEWGKAVARAELKWRKMQHGYANSFTLGNRRKHHYSKHTHTVAQWTGLLVQPLHPKKQPKTAAEKALTEERSLQVSAARQKVVGLRQLRVRSTTAWKPGTSVAATYHKSKNSAVVKSDITGTEDTEASSTHHQSTSNTVEGVNVAGIGSNAAGPNVTAPQEDSSDEDYEDEVLEEEEYQQVVNDGGVCTYSNGDDVAVLVAAKSSEGPFWLAKLRNMSKAASDGTVQIKYYAKNVEADCYVASTIEIIAVGAILGRVSLEQEGDRFYLDEDQQSLWTSTANMSRTTIVTSRRSMAQKRTHSDEDEYITGTGTTSNQPQLVTRNGRSLKLTKKAQEQQHLSRGRGARGRNSNRGRGGKGRGNGRAPRTNGEVSVEEDEDN